MKGEGLTETNTSGDDTPTEFNSAAAVLDAVRARVRGFPEDFEQRLDEKLGSVFGHLDMQVLIYACRLIVPGMPRQVFAPDATGHDLMHWLGKAVESGRTRFSPRKRGSYMSADATLRPIVEQDVSALYLAALDPRSGHRWRYRGRTPSPDAFRRSLFGEGVLAQFAVVSLEDRSRAVGLVSAYSADIASGHCYVAFQRADPGRSPSPTRGLMIEGILIFIQYLFDHFNLFKIYLEIPEYNLDLVIGGATSILQLEGRLAKHYYYGERRWDQYIYALYKDAWDEIASLFRADWEDGTGVSSSAVAAP